ncbi:PspA/IM30 family protein [Parasphaerochaeta coccoides]|uniref:Phage shock protein A, PspA n=1 Tax=Parasphaerochaeta coccoides (strain ATCC BAA-1237 / DSM 17374 / SPN1) TaxID=760011 RepID=F4GJV6_PARC1|nr:PspA/IM30 family protein [Parasphaerochaeta coccoides]AEC01381.1 phage shock protein A, PspA [Parasphaerochaeta coccoides DSM 17374]
MKTFSRLKNIITSHVNSALDKIEDPEKMIALMINELEDKKVELQTAIVATTAQATDIRREAKVIDETIERWETRARLAVDKGRDDLAREALTEKKRQMERSSVVRQEIAQLESIIASQKEQLEKMTSKLQEIRDKKRSFVTRTDRAKQKKEVARVLAETDGTSIIERFNAMEQKIERMEADAEVTSWESSARTPDASFAQMEADDEVEKELARLKAAITPAPAPKKGADKSPQPEDVKE